MQAWIDALPMTQVFEASRTLTRSLAELNRVRLSDEDRLRLMEIIYPNVVILQEELGHDFTGAALPLPTKAREAAALAREMLIETSYAYKLALLDKSAKGGLFSAKRNAALPVGRAISALSDILTTSYRSYNPAPAGVWFEILPQMKTPTPRIWFTRKHCYSRSPILIIWSTTRKTQYKE